MRNCKAPAKSEHQNGNLSLEGLSQLIPRKTGIGGHMKSVRFILNQAALIGTAAFLFVSSIYFTSCKQDEDSSTDNSINAEKLAADDPLIRVWSTGYSTISIAEDSLKDHETYKMKNLYVQKFDKTSGIIYGQYTYVLDWDKPENQKPEEGDYYESFGQWYPLNESLIGKWYAVAYKNLSNNTISYSGAYKAGGSKAEPTLAKAIKEFTIEKGYFSTYTDCTTSN